jgi:DNA-binding transcriptional LysR family regulator
LQRLGLQARIRLTLPHFTVVPAILKQTDLALILPRRPARRFAALYGQLAVIEADLGLPQFDVSLYWVARAQHDPAHLWLRERVKQLFAE